MCVLYIYTKGDVSDRRIYDTKDECPLTELGDVRGNHS